MMWITPYTQDTELPEPHEWTIEHKIKMFEEIIYGWHLHIAEQMVNEVQDAQGQIIDKRINHCDYAALQIVLSYPETIAKYWHGYTEHGRSREFFVKGIHLLFRTASNATSDVALGYLYEWSRCSLYHSTTSRIWLTSEEIAIRVRPDGIIEVNTHTLIPHMIDHLRKYCALLRNPTETERRNNFLKRFEVDHM